MAPAPQKVALVTGAARGIGLAVAKRFLAEGWRVALLDIEEGLLAGAVAGLANPGSTMALPCDVSDSAAVADALARVVRPARCAGQQCRDRGVRAAAGDLGGRLEPGAGGQPDRAVHVHQGGAAADARIRRRRGGQYHLDLGGAASTLRSAYGTSKAGLAHLTKQLAVELASLGIRVNGVAPGPVETAMAKQVHTPEIRADYHDAIPLNRYGLEEELAEAVFFLCSDRASYITGQILAVDGGFDAAGIGLPTLRGQRRNG